APETCTMSPDPTDRFTDRVADYVHARPSYPRAIHEILAAEHGLAPDHVITDVGSGTGKLAKVFLARGHRVFGVEPNAAMRQAAEVLFRGEKRFIIVDGTAEATGLKAESTDWVVAGQAFHWFDIDGARMEFARILRAPRRVALIWNDRNTEDSDLMRDYETLLARHGIDYAEVKRRQTADDPVARFFGPEKAAEHRFRHDQVLDRHRLRRRLQSSSFVPAVGAPGHEAMLGDLDELFARHQQGGEVRLLYSTRVCVGRLAENG
ncbi:MAG: class I SAM-dependent methyltransferase, partial [Acidobacteriota bacterium]